MSQNEEEEKRYNYNKKWGPVFWRVIFSLAKHVDYTVQKMEGNAEFMAYYPECVAAFFTSFRSLLPCSVCCQHYNEYLLNTNIQEYIKNKNIKGYFFALKNQINARNHKPQLNEDQFKNEMTGIEIEPNAIINVMFILAVTFEGNPNANKIRDTCIFMSVLPFIMPPNLPFTFILERHKWKPAVLSNQAAYAQFIDDIVKSYDAKRGTNSELAHSLYGSFKRFMSE